MRVFAALYQRALGWSRHPHAERYLAGLSLVEAFAFPVAPELMLAPMCLAQPRRGLRYASVSLVFSLIGSLIGYALGHYAFDALQPLLLRLGWMAPIERLVGELRVDVAQHPWTAFWLLVLAGFTPLPLKLFTWASGIVGVPLLAFFASMAIGRGKRVYLLAALLRWLGPRAERFLARWVEWLGWGAIGALVLVGTWFGLT
jgi:membrane protein YqaA with SNARE-associated domain